VWRSSFNGGGNVKDLLAGVASLTPVMPGSMTGRPASGPEIPDTFSVLAVEKGATAGAVVVAADVVSREPKLDMDVGLTWAPVDADPFSCRWMLFATSIMGLLIFRAASFPAFAARSTAAVEDVFIDRTEERSSARDAGWGESRGVIMGGGDCEAIDLWMQELASWTSALGAGCWEATLCESSLSMGYGFDCMLNVVAGKAITEEPVSGWGPARRLGRAMGVYIWCQSQYTVHVKAVTMKLLVLVLRHKGQCDGELILTLYILLSNWTVEGGDKMVHLNVEMIFKAYDGHTGVLLKMEAADAQRGGMGCLKLVWLSTAKVWRRLVLQMQTREVRWGCYVEARGELKVKWGWSAKADGGEHRAGERPDKAWYAY
jgi:hypothetical protein